MAKNKYNFIIDALMFLCMSLIAGIGFLMKYVLIPGSERWVKYGSNVDLSFLGLGRHEWGTIHLVIAFILLGLLLQHILLHIKWITAACRTMFAGKIINAVVAIAFVLVCLFFIMFSFFIEPKVTDIGEGRGGQGMGFQGFGKHR